MTPDLAGRQSVITDQTGSGIPLRHLFKIILAGLALPTLIGSAAAQDIGAQNPREACDWFRNALIGTRCAGTYALGASLTVERFNYDGLGSLWYRDYESFRFKPSAGFSVTPTSWLTLDVSSAYSALFQTSAVHHAPMKNRQYAAHAAPPYSYLPTSKANFDTQAVTANVNLWDSGGASGQRYVVNAFVADSVIPGHDGIHAENDLYGGLIFNGSWPLSASGLSLATTGRVSAHHRTGPEDNLHAYTTASLLLAHDRLGVAFGPLYEGAYWLSSSGARSDQSDVQWAGAKAIWQPFRTSEVPLWNGLVLNATALHTIGPARWVPADEADTRHLVVTGTAAWHFRY